MTKKRVVFGITIVAIAGVATYTLFSQMGVQPSKMLTAVIKETNDEDKETENIKAENKKIENKKTENSIIPNDKELTADQSESKPQLAQSSNSILNESGETIESRYNPPDGFTRFQIDQESFGSFLRSQTLKPYGEKVQYYNGAFKPSEGVYDSVINVDIGDKNLHQCADAVMLLRAEYFYKSGNYKQIAFHFTNGFEAQYQKWMEGYRISISGDHVSWSKKTAASKDYNTFRKYMDIVFAYAGTASLEKELISVHIKDMGIGDVFIKGGSPGHAVIVVDMAENKQTGEKAFLLAQSYMPAQQTQILINPSNREISPWYILDADELLVTPEWQFDKTQLKRFQ